MVSPRDLREAEQQQQQSSLCAQERAHREDTERPLGQRGESSLKRATNRGKRERARDEGHGAIASAETLRSLTKYMKEAEERPRGERGQNVTARGREEERERERRRVDWTEKRE
eukprot:scaffold70782_cov28-Tisochrysis_lutea.AAC.1